MRIKEYSLFDGEKLSVARSYHSLLSPSKREYNAHHHTECELSVFIEGSGVYAVGDKRYSFKRGDIFLFGSHEEHCVIEITEPIDLLNLQFEPYLLWEPPGCRELLALFYSRNASFENRFCDITGKITEHIQGFEWELMQKMPCYTSNAMSHLFMALSEIMRNYPYFELDRTVRTSNTTTKGLRSAIDYIHKNLQNRLTLDEIARVACLSPSYFSHLFKSYNGITLWDYINIKRVERAIAMLKENAGTKLEIAECCGFQSSSNFYKIFAAVTGKRPKDYIKDIKNAK